ncbi:MAG: hypothetical protein PVJ00_00850, partial [Desulfobacterales bacterium]
PPVYRSSPFAVSLSPCAVMICMCLLPSTVSFVIFNLTGREREAMVSIFKAPWPFKATNDKPVWVIGY